MEDNPWRSAMGLDMIRRDPNGKEHVLEPGVKFFVLALEALGVQTLYSCEGHPRGFYVMFRGTYRLACKVAESGILTVRIVQNGIHRSRTWLVDLPYLRGKPTALSQVSILWMRDLFGLSTPWDAAVRSLEHRVDIIRKGGKA
jgi:hypothetical protein